MFMMHDEDCDRPAERGARSSDYHPHAERPCGETADATDLKSVALDRASGFESRRGYFDSTRVYAYQLVRFGP